MKVILLRDIKNVGRKYELKELNDGFARNGLIAKGLALPATPENMGKMKNDLDRVARGAELKRDIIERGLKEIGQLSITLAGKTNPEGHLFAAIHASEIAKAIEQEKGIKIDPAWIDMKPLKTAGEHRLTMRIDSNKAEFIVLVKGTN